MKFREVYTSQKERMKSEWKEQRFRRLVGLLVCLAALFAVAEFVLGHIAGYMAVDACFRYIGCNVSYFGYDGVVHWIAGLTIGVIILLVLLWHYQKVPPPHKVWKTVSVIFLLALLVAIAWELVEYAADSLNIIILKPINGSQYQLSTADTIGDIFVSTLGSLMSAVPILKYLHLVVASGKEIESSHPQEN